VIVLILTKPRSILVAHSSAATLLPSLASADLSINQELDRVVELTTKLGT
jgi:hypothetical protein